MLTRALLMTSSHSEGRRSTGEHRAPIIAIVVHATQMPAFAHLYCASVHLCIAIMLAFAVALILVAAL